MPVQRFARQVVCAACAALLIAGCGEAASTSRTSGAQPSTATQAAQPPRATDDESRARLGLLRREGIPGKIVAQDLSRNRARCSPRRLFKRLATGIATTPRYRTADAELQESVLLFRDAATAARAFRRLDAPATRRCIARGIRQSASTRLEHQLAELTELTITVEPTGQQSSAYRLTLPIPGHTASAEVLVSRIGRALASTLLVWSETPPDLEFQDALVAHIAEQAQRSLG